MKKLLSIILAAIMLVLVFSVPAYAMDSEATDYKYYDKMVELNYGREPWEYYELFYHYSDENGEEPDWTLIYAYTDGDLYLRKFGVAIGDTVLWSVGGGDRISWSRYSVYVTATDEIIPIEYKNIEQIVKYCPDFVEVVRESNFGQLFGDINDDMKIDIFDVTYIQRMLAEHDDTVKARYSSVSDVRSNLSILEFVDTVEIYEDGTYGYICISDYDRDGETTVMDATAIQKKLAQIEDTTPTE